MDSCKGEMSGVFSDSGLARCFRPSGRVPPRSSQPSVYIIEAATRISHSRPFTHSQQYAGPPWAHHLAVLPPSYDALLFPT